MSGDEQNSEEISMNIGDIQAKMNKVGSFIKRRIVPDQADIQNQQMEETDMLTDTGESESDRVEQVALSVNIEALISLLSDLGTGLWRMQKAMIDRGTGKPSDEMQRLSRYLSTMLDSLQDRGVEIRDHTGERVPDSGIYGLKVITYEPRDDLQNEVVIDTIKPTVTLGNKIVQMGEVIIGIPKVSENDQEKE